MENNLNMLENLLKTVPSALMAELKKANPEHSELIDIIVNNQDKGVDEIKEYIAKMYPDKKDEIMRTFEDGNYAENFAKIQSIKKDIGSIFTQHINK